MARPRSALLAAEPLLERARLEADLGRPKAAVRLAMRSLQTLDASASGGTSLRSRILIFLAYQKAELGDLAEAAQLFDRASDLDPSVRPLAENNRGQLLARNGRPDEAIEHFNLAIQGLRDDTSELGLETLATVLLNRGVLHMSSGLLRVALADTEAAAEVARSSNARVLDFMTTHNLGYIKFLAGDLPGALDTMSAARQSLPGGAVGVPAMDRARVLLAAGLIAESREAIDEAISAFQVNRATADLAESLEVGAEVHLALGDPDSARAHAAKALGL